MKQNDIIRLKTPESVKRTGKPEYMLVVKNGIQYKLKWGADFRVSNRCDPDNKVANLDHNGDYPLINKKFVKQHKNQFKLIKKGK